MEVSNVYIEDNSTLTRYLFNFCLYLDKDSAQNCTSGNFSSLPQQSRNYFLTAFEESSHQRSRQGNTTVDISPQTSNKLLISAFTSALVVIVMFTMFVLIRCMKANTKRLERKLTITIPEEIDMDAHNHFLLKTDDTVNLTDIESCATELQDLLKDTESRSSVETFGEYDFVPSETPSPKSSIIFRYQMKDEVCCNTKEEVNANPMSEVNIENNVQIHAEAATPKLLFKRNDTALGHDVMKCEVMHVKSPGGGSNQEDSNDDNHDDYDNNDNAVAPVDRSIDLHKSKNVVFFKYIIIIIVVYNLLTCIFINVCLIHCSIMYS